ncbi:hypothetical protein FA15DRAFT_615019 [Coprinopsis marcescibilis]|uniref:Cation/H+ exchanger transmembrane domain-containing protein n=1 Tax=Coprinopsis marcescibilis TaxID=230819 RepID=A0A5C3L2D8_COPMA|nr:hypothetical protein FA15DRAFT_615019 [Coprinopsis marcescibilis]
MPEFSQQVFQLIQRRSAPEQGGLLSGQDPTSFSPADPIRLWIVQVGIIICTASVLSLGLRKLHQPKVIAEVLGGIILGPTAFGRIPGFTQHVFPEDSRAYLGLVANIGLCLFLFLVGLEIDAGVIKRNARLSATVALAGMILPFAIGSGLSVAIYEEFIDPSVKFTHFMLFTGVAYSITAFPVLCRILTELKLLDTTVGIVVLSAGVGNDIIGWTLLALSVALVNAGNGLTALYILLVCVAWTITVLFPIKWALKWLARKTGSIEDGPSVFFMTVTMLVLFGSAFLTDVIGVHAIFGAFLAGLIVPREGGLAIALTEKLEDMVSIIFLPLYFTLSGLSTDLGLLNSGKIWGYTIAIVATAFIGKFGGCSLGARYVAGFSWRESAAIGSLMSCKGLVELIVLNVGLSAGILSRRVFSMFVLEALVLTFMTTPLVTWLYPPNKRVRVSADGSNFKHLGDGEDGDGEAAYPKSREGEKKTRFTVVLDKFEHLAGMMALTQLVNPIRRASLPPLARPESIIREKSHGSSSKQGKGTLLSLQIPTQAQVSLEALRVIELSDRVSAVMKSSAADAVLRSDPLLSAFRMFGALNHVKIDPSLVIVQFDQMAYSIVEQAREYGSDMILVPWLTSGKGVNAYEGVPRQVNVGNPVSAGPSSSHPHPRPPHSSTMADAPASAVTAASTHAPLTPNLLKSPLLNPFETMFSSFRQPIHQSAASVIHAQFVRSVFKQAAVDVGLFVDLGMLDVVEGAGFGGGVYGLEDGSGASSGGRKQHLFLPFFGGPDDRLALEFVVQLCDSEDVSATVVRITRREREDEGGRRPEDTNALTVGMNLGIGGAAYPDTVYGQQNSEFRMQSETADNVLWTKHAKIGSGGVSRDGSGSQAQSPRSPTSGSDGDFGTAVGPVHPRILFKEIGTLAPLQIAVREAQRLLVGDWSPQASGREEDIGESLPVSPVGAVSGRSDSVVDVSAAGKGAEGSDITSPVDGSGSRGCGPLIVVTGRSRRLAVENHRVELKELMDEHGGIGGEVRKTIGDVASAFVVADVGSGVLVLQAAVGGEVD